MPHRYGDIRFYAFGEFSDAIVAAGHNPRSGTVVSNLYGRRLYREDVRGPWWSLQVHMESLDSGWRFRNRSGDPGVVGPLAVAVPFVLDRWQFDGSLEGSRRVFLAHLHEGLLAIAAQYDLEAAAFVRTHDAIIDSRFDTKYTPAKLQKWSPGRRSRAWVEVDEQEHDTTIKIVAQDRAEGSPVKSVVVAHTDLGESGAYRITGRLRWRTADELELEPNRSHRFGDPYGPPIRVRVASDVLEVLK
jgi:hypothetical protein